MTSTKWEVGYKITSDYVKGQVYQRMDSLHHQHGFSDHSACTLLREDKMRVRVTDEVHCSMGGKAQTVVIQRDQVYKVSTSVV